jgi:SAM-dependent methyltransferase
VTALRTGASFRDPDGFVFTVDGQWRRQLHAAARPAWERFCESGLSDQLVADGLLWPWQDLTAAEGFDANAWHVIGSEPFPFISYPYEWSPTQLRAAALLTLRVQRSALAAGLTLKDASAYNVQFDGARPVFLDTLSFALHTPGAPWAGYRQFCQHFLAPLALMAYCDPRLGTLSRVHLDGIPLDLAARLLPRRTRWRAGLAVHLHLHARAITTHARARTTPAVATRGLRPGALEALLAHLESVITGLRVDTAGSTWADYPETHGYSAAGQVMKEQVVREVAQTVAPRLALDLGANTGRFSALLRETGAFVVAVDHDVGAVDRHVRSLTDASRSGVLPLLVDATDPSPALGWAHAERSAFTARAEHADLVLALALVHHLAIGNNVPLDALVRWIARLGRTAVIEWVPKDDPQVARLLVSRPDVFSRYTREDFVAACTAVGRISRVVRVPDSARELFVVERQ